MFFIEKDSFFPKKTWFFKEFPNFFFNSWDTFRKNNLDFQLKNWKKNKWNKKYGFALVWCRPGTHSVQLRCNFISCCSFIKVKRFKTFLRDCTIAIDRNLKLRMLLQKFQILCGCKTSMSTEQKRNSMRKSNRIAMHEIQKGRMCHRMYNIIIQMGIINGKNAIAISNINSQNSKPTYCVIIARQSCVYEFE